MAAGDGPKGQEGLPKATEAKATEALSADSSSNNVRQYHANHSRKNNSTLAKWKSVFLAVFLTGLALLNLVGTGMEHKRLLSFLEPDQKHLLDRTEWSFRPPVSPRHHHHHHKATKQQEETAVAAKQQGETAVAAKQQEETTVATKQQGETAVVAKRRSKVHFCKDKRTLHGRNVLRDEFGFVETDANVNDDWDLIYGGYAFCGGKEKKHDRRMEAGLNKKLNESGWENLKPHQVYHPCVGCKGSYCDKKNLCGVLSEIDPSLCYMMPRDIHRLRKDMKDANKGAKEKTPFVLKTKGHGGRGVQLITHPKDLPEREDSSEYIVQKWLEPYMGEGVFHRKTELRVHVAITSVYPLRAYVHRRHIITFASMKYENTSMALENKCMSDTSSNVGECKEESDQEYLDFLSSVPNRYKNQVLLKEYVDAGGMSRSDVELLLMRSYNAIAKVLRVGHSPLEQHAVNQGIRASGAVCFSEMRFDLGIGVGLEPLVYEVTEIPSKNGPGDIIANVSRDLFHMIGLDAPPVPADKRAAYEMDHLGGWRLLPDLDV